MKVLFLSAALLASSALVAAGQAAPAPSAPSAPAVQPVRHVDAKAAEKLLAEDKAKAKQIVVLDVRTREEYDAGHLEGSVNLDFNAPDFEAEVKGKLDPKKTSLVHCGVGGGSRRSLPKLQAAGITNLVHLDGGFTAWEEAGCAVKKPAE
ncbi:MAG TPA: rhodanese-like domain-containing protein [Verrucomicrobiota bacterium]|nr:rhodanese-like domain-containing protein [Verrucomicrobiota bacterium]